MRTKKIKVLIVDDSALVRQTLTSILESDADIEVSGTASDPYIAVRKIKETLPDVITLDIEMPKMDGLTFLQKLMAQQPIPTLVISTLTEEGSDTAIRALEYGAIDIISKPKVNTRELLKKTTAELCEKVKITAQAKTKRRLPQQYALNVPPKLSVDAVISNKTKGSLAKTTEIVLAIGASTGGTEAVKNLLLNMPLDCPGMIIVLHMPELFTRQFAKRLDDLCKHTVKEAQNGDAILRGTVLIAPGNKHTLLNRSGANYYVEVKDGELVNRHRPSIDVLFTSVARFAGKNAIGVIMTGMGDDGAKGLLEMKQSGAHTVAQDEASSVVFGMPNAAIKLKAVDKVLPLSNIAAHLIYKEKEKLVSTKLTGS